MNRYDDAPEEQRLTTWRNPTRHDIKIDLHETPGRKKRFLVPAGKEVQIPSEYDRGIHDVRDGVIVGGYAPLLERVVSDGILHPALDPEAAAEKAALEQAEKTVIAKKAADEVLAQTKTPANAKR